MDNNSSIIFIYMETQNIGKNGINSLSYFPFPFELLGPSNPKIGIDYFLLSVICRLMKSHSILKKKFLIGLIAIHRATLHLTIFKKTILNQFISNFLSTKLQSLDSLAPGSPGL